MYDGTGWAISRPRRPIMTFYLPQKSALILRLTESTAILKRPKIHRNIFRYTY